MTGVIVATRVASSIREITMTWLFSTAFERRPNWPGYTPVLAAKVCIYSYHFEFELKFYFSQTNTIQGNLIISHGSCQNRLNEYRQKRPLATVHGRSAGVQNVSNQRKAILLSGV